MGDLTADKCHTKICLHEVGISVPRGFAANSKKEALLLLKKIKLHFPLIFKPVNGAFAERVVWDIKTKKELIDAILDFKKSEKKHKFKRFLIEEMQLGDEYRVLMLQGRVVSCVQKRAASILGDGKLSIENLIRVFNKNRERGFDIKVDSIVLDKLKKEGLTMRSILPKNYLLKLRNNLNMSDGGRSIDYTDKMNAYFKKICCKAIKTVGLNYGGIDLITENISQQNSAYAIIEINPDPVYIMHEKPLVEGRGIDVSHKILKILFPKLK
jgi:cyanophycin synthetase